MLLPRLRQKIHLKKVQPNHQLSVGILKRKILKSIEKPPKLNEYDGKGYPDECVHIKNDQLSYFSVDDAPKCKLFALTLVESAQLWFNSLPKESIDSWPGLCERCYSYFTGRKRQPVTKTALSRMA